MRHIYAIFILEFKSYITYRVAIFWTLAYPILMLAFLIGVFEHTHAPDFRFASVVGLVMLTLISTAIFGLAQALGSARASKALLFYMATPASYLEITLAIVLSRLAIVLGFSALFILGSFSVLGILPSLSVGNFLLGLLTLGLAGVFCSGVALGVVKYLNNNQNMLAIANVINLYAIMSSNVFIPLQALPSWGQIFITSSPFYHLNNMLIGAFSGQNLGYVLGVSGVLFGLGALLTYLGAGRALLVSTPKSR
ncbi:ABC transporter permease [Helicobacter baculiformis]|uniref:ABC transporter permease n=1 Tax=Helicobacter baculiformis TaxID=427351 RepID=A0ABV7ZHS5_9HELI|nr:ABC transporter permease [Helicobacter baculiformis]